MALLSCPVLVKKELQYLFGLTGSDLQTDSSELLDIVDDQDRVIGAATRGEIHQRGLTHRSIHVLVFDGAGSVLLQKRSMQKDQCGGMWDTSCAGHVEAGQDYLETAPRELEEELGITVGALESLFKMTPTADNGHEFAMVYSVVNQGPFVPAEDEIDELRWYTFEQVDEWLLSQLKVVSKIKDNVHSDSQDLTSGFMEIWKRYRNCTS